MSVRTKLTMRCDITPVAGQDEHGDVVLGSTVNAVACFIFGDTTRDRTHDVQEYNQRYQVLFNPEADIRPDYKIANIVNHRGAIVFPGTVTVVRVEDNWHPKVGLKLRQAFVEKR